MYDIYCNVKIYFRSSVHDKSFFIKLIFILFLPVVAMLESKKAHTWQYFFQLFSFFKIILTGDKKNINFFQFQFFSWNCNFLQIFTVHSVEIGLGPKWKYGSCFLILMLCKRWSIIFFWVFLTVDVKWKNIRFPVLCVEMWELLGETFEFLTTKMQENKSHEHLRGERDQSSRKLFFQKVRYKRFCFGSSFCPVNFSVDSSFDWGIWHFGLCFETQTDTKKTRPKSRRQIFWLFFSQL